jgi:hypothetical protein
MDGKWAYRCDPTVQVRILCVDRPHNGFPVISIDACGDTHLHTSRGHYHCRGAYTPRDLVPIQREPREPHEIWAVRHADNWISSYHTTEKQAENLVNIYVRRGLTANAVRFREVLE